MKTSIIPKSSKMRKYQRKSRRKSQKKSRHKSRRKSQKKSRHKSRRKSQKKSRHKSRKKSRHKSRKKSRRKSRKKSRKKLYFKKRSQTTQLLDSIFNSVQNGYLVIAIDHDRCLADLIKNFVHGDREWTDMKSKFFEIIKELAGGRLVYLISFSARISDLANFAQTNSRPSNLETLSLFKEQLEMEGIESIIWNQYPIDGDEEIVKYLSEESRDLYGQLQLKASVSMSTPKEKLGITPASLRNEIKTITGDRKIKKLLAEKIIELFPNELNTFLFIDDKPEILMFIKESELLPEGRIEYLWLWPTVLKINPITLDDVWKKDLSLLTKWT